MRSSLSVAVLLAVLIARPARSQSGPEANLVLTILGGTVIGHSLWTVDRQPLCITTGIACSGTYDTLRLSRSITSSLLLGAGATYFPSPHLGVHAEVSYMGLPVDSECSAVFVQSGSNQQICDDIAAQTAGGGAIAMMVGATARAATRRALSPYLRTSIGLVNQSRSTIEMEGAYLNSGGTVSTRQVVVDEHPRRTSLLLGASAGFTAPFGTGYQFRFEARDIVTKLDRLTGPANSLGVGPVASRSYHHFSLTLGFDVVLEKKRGRRY